MQEKKPISYAVKFFIFSLLTALIILTLGVAYGKFVEKNEYSLPLPSSTNFDEVTIVIDPGHGGEDPGSVGADGTLEKDLNLEIARLVYAFCILNGTEARMTRTEDTLLYDYYGDLKDYTGQKKVYDLKNRLKIAEEEENALYLGIHMNKFSQERYSGAQIYYSPNSEESQRVASNLSKKIKDYLQPDNNRKIKRADSSIFILKNIENPAILVECGFLSNENELKMLNKEEYRAQLALTIFASVCEYK
ncbi:MAG: N-acetylmuramoyl-L-alanine amidase [Clostridia bacterium]|nr:N-acetylmuramoyl-L-alanine amidase [Clostridia bacterium]